MSTTHNPKRDTTPFDPSFACLSSENPQAIQSALDRLIATHSPANPHELSCLHRIALAEVRYFRAIAQETALLELALAESAPGLDSKFKHLDAPTRAALAEQSLATRNSALEAVRRQQGRLRRESESALRAFLLLKKQRPK
ncbi:MAG: hypothetical protein K2Q23_07295 [Bryobacteraceae bacterium]|nr:hypothetical protein [Bryobacteraceae bacterium]